MGIFDSLFGRPRHSEFEIKVKACTAVQAYQKKNFSFAAKLFAEYFSMKGYGFFPELDADDYRMYFNLMLSQFYAQMYEDTIATCKKIQIIKPDSGDSFAFQALSEKALGNIVEANKLWTRASINGCELTEHFPDIEDVVMVGYNN